MNLLFVFLCMIFCHVVADYNLQGILASMKQKKWWKDQGIYNEDYSCALIMHSISWSFMIMLPIAAYYSFKVDMMFVTWLLLNTIGHALVDHMKANKQWINLWVDQMLHMFQIGCTFVFYAVAETVH